MSTHYGKKALNRNYASLAGAKEDNRLKFLSKSAHGMGELIAGEQLSQQDVVPSLLNACMKNGLVKELTKGRVVEIIMSGITEGMKTPRKLASKQFQSKEGAKTSKFKQNNEDNQTIVGEHYVEKDHDTNDLPW